MRQLHKQKMYAVIPFAFLTFLAVVFSLKAQSDTVRSPYHFTA